MKKLKFKKLIYSLLLFLSIGFIITFIWSDGEMTKIMGGSTAVVDVSSIIKPSETIRIKNINVLSQDCNHFTPNQDVIIKNGKIVSISQNQATANSSAVIIDGTDKFLIPGLVDSHVHLKESKNDMLLYLVNGVTYVREMAGRPIALEWRKSIQKNGIGPRMFIASPPIYCESGLTGYYYGWSRKAINYSDKKEAEKAIKRICEQGYDAIKMYGFVNEEMFKTTLEIAEKYKIPVIGHIPLVSLETFYTSGQKEIAHIEELTKKTMENFGSSIYANPDEYLKYLNEHADEVAVQVRKNNIVVTSTIWLMESLASQSVNLESTLKTVELKYVNPAIVEGTILHKLGWLPGRNGYEHSDEVKNNNDLRKKEIKFWKTYAEAIHIMAKALLKNKVEIMAGTDANVPMLVPGFSLHDELVSLTKSGMTNSQALYSATVAPNEWMKSNSGKIKIGYNSDLVLLAENPLDDIKNTKTIEYVFFDNHMIDKSQIRTILKAIEDANNKNRNTEIDEFIN
jgi:hypothetical protein